MTVSLISMLGIIGTVMPSSAHASVWSVIVNSIKGNTAQAETLKGVGNVQTMPLLKPAMNIDPSPDRGGGDITIVDSSALVSGEGPSDSLSKPKNSTISTYVVKEGDTITGIAALFDVTPDTIRWANDMTRASSIKVGQQLTILPVTGIKYTIKKGDTLASIAKRFDGDLTEIESYNGLDDTLATVGTEIIIPNGEIAAPPPAPTPVHNTIKVAKLIQVPGVVETAVHEVTTAFGYYSAPLAHYIKTQGIHGYNGVDLAAPVGTPIMAAADGEVIVAKEGGYNGGYGSYIVIQHDNGSQTLYAHQSRLAASEGDHVSKGEVIGYVGNSGRVSGPTGYHLHFEIRNGIRNPF